jgi:hypothetical protein
VLADIDENLIRAGLSTAQRAKFTAARKKAYLAAHPEAGRGKAPVDRGGKKETAKSAVSFAAMTRSSKTGRSVRSVDADVARAEAPGDGIDRVPRTSLDKGAELDALPRRRAQAMCRLAPGFQKRAGST